MAAGIIHILGASGRWRNCSSSSNHGCNKKEPSGQDSSFFSFSFHGSNRWQAIQNRQQQYALAVLFSFFKFYNIF